MLQLLRLSWYKGRYQKLLDRRNDRYVTDTSRRQAMISVRSHETIARFKLVLRHRYHLNSHLFSINKLEVDYRTSQAVLVISIFYLNGTKQKRASYVATVGFPPCLFIKVMERQVNRLPELEKIFLVPVPISSNT